MQEINETADALGLRICTCIKMKRQLQPGEHRVVTAIGKRLVRQLRTGRLASTQCEAADVAVFKIEDDKLVPMLAEQVGKSFGATEDADIIGKNKQVLATNETIERVRRGLPVREIPGGYCAIWRPPTPGLWDDEDKRVEELVGRFDKKVAQTRDETGARRLLIAEVAEATKIAEGNKSDPRVVRVLRKIQRKLVLRHQRIAGILLVSRVWTTKQRYQYVSYALQGRDEHALPADFQFRVGLVDYTVDFLN